MERHADPFDTDLDPADRELRDAVRRVATEQVAPRAAAVDADGAFPAESVSVLAELGLFGILVPAELGGLSGTRVQATLAIEELARACGATALTLMAHIHATALLVGHGSEEVKQRWLPDAATGDALGAVALTEPEAGSDVGSLMTTATPTGSGHVLNGRKTFITNGDRAGFLCVFARDGGPREGDQDGGPREGDQDGGPREGDQPAPRGAAASGGVSAFVIDGRDPGVSCSRPLDKMGVRGSTTVELALDDVEVTADARLGEEGQGLAIAFRSLDGARLSTAAQAAGLARGAFDLAFAYLRERVQFGRPVVEHQAVRIRLADMYAELSAGRALTHQVARMMDRDPDHSHALEASAAKVFSTDTAMRVTTEAVQLLGGYGYIRDHQVERFMRDAKGGQIYDGTNDINRLLVVRQLLGRS